MSSIDPHDYDLDRPDAPPGWLARFVRDEARPLLLRHHQAARAAWDRWLAGHEERKRQLSAWEARRAEFLRQLAARGEGQQHGPESPPEDLVWMLGRVAMSDGTSTLIGGWGPPELNEYSGPDVTYPLPPPPDRDLSPDECWVTLLAVHAVAREPGEQLGPADSSPFTVLCRLALELTEAQLQDLRPILRTVSSPGADPLQDGTGQGEGPAATSRNAKGRGGRRKLAETDPKLQVYLRIRREREGGTARRDIPERLKGDKDFMEQVHRAKLKLNKKLVKSALDFFAWRKKRETHRS
jgi:hypothetical protein